MRSNWLSWVELWLEEILLFGAELNRRLSRMEHIWTRRQGQTRALDVHILYKHNYEATLGDFG